MEGSYIHEILRPSLVKRDFGSLFHVFSFSIESAIRFMSLLLHRRAKFEQFIWYRLVCCFQDIDQSVTPVRWSVFWIFRTYSRSRQCFILLREESDRLAFHAGSPSPPNTVDVVFGCKRESYIYD